MANKFYRKDICDDQKEMIATLRLSRTNSIGPITFLKLLDKHHTPSKALDATIDILSKKGKTVRSEADILQELDNIKKDGANVITIFDEKYPAPLSEIQDPPIVLTYKGSLEKLGDNNVAMVGARYASANAISFAYQLCKDLSKNGSCVISGLARGIDTAAHKGALAAKSKNLSTVAVIAGGIDNIYPPENEKLFKELAEKALIVSENEFGTVPKAENFPRRNRIISGLSQVICVVEAAMKSGSLITAKFALDQGRDVACVPGFPMDPRSEGTNSLIKKGAAIVTNYKDILELMNHAGSNRIKNNYSLKEEFENEFVFEGEDANYIEQNNNLLALISNSPTDIDDLIAHGFSAADINSKLLEYEITGEIIRLPGNKVSKVA